MGDRDDEDRRIAEAMAAGDARTAVPLLMDRYGERIYSYCRRMLGSDAEADDASQMVFLQAFEAIERRAQVDNPGAWLRGIARHRCLDGIDRRHRDPLLLDEAELQRMIDARAAAGSQLLDPRLQQLLDECLDALDARSRTAVLLRHHDHLSYEEIGGKTGDKPGALRVRVARALRVLRDCLEKKGGAL